MKGDLGAALHFISETLLFATSLLSFSSRPPFVFYPRSFFFFWVLAALF